MNPSRVSPTFTTLLLCLVTACGEVDTPAVQLPVAGDETGELADSDAASEGQAESADHGAEPGAITTDGSTSDGEEELPSTRITALWTESEGTYLRALPGEALAMALPQVAEVAAFFPSVEQAVEDDSAYISLLDESGDPLMATRLRSVATHPDGFAVEGGSQMSYFSKWGVDFPIGLCVTEPCFLYPWEQAPSAAKFSLGDQMWIDGEVAGNRFYAHYIQEGEESSIVEEKGFEYLAAEDLVDFKRAKAAAMDLADLSVQVSEHPQAAADADPCEFFENAVQGGVAFAGAACCTETGGLACLGCFAIAESVFEWLEELC